ncbi:MAG TPA: CusA/CzcA family heavy metal efflux RND transporter [Xanthobacteraceae bacterium]|jgi:cobalt-zinc-cadmium resistance protein CzcA|nr:CusA/CzcA family heavy metal efflux RND transporter [Xanthobacteraceae bacterium]
MHRLIDLSLRNKFLVLILTAVMVGVGIYSMLRLPIDAVPDVTPNQVLVLTQAPGLGPVEVERFITFPVETAMSGLPGITDIRSISRFGLSSVYIYFEEGMDLYFVRRLVMERLPEAREAIPAGLGTPTMGPISTGLGEIFQFEVRGKGKSLMDLRSVLEWDIAFRLRSVPGVVEVNSYGGEMKTYEVQIDPDKLVSYKVPLDTVFEALERNNANAGGAYIERAQEQYVIRGEGLVERVNDIDNIVVSAAADGTPVYIRNLGQTVLAPQVRQGAVTRDGDGETVTGVVMMLMGENSRVVAARVRDALDAIKPSLPEGVTIETYYDRTQLVQKTIATVRKNLIEGGVLVVAVLLLLLGNVRGGLVVASAIPLSMLFAFTGMVQAGLSGNLMSLGAIDFGLIVDGSVVMIENIVRRLGEAKGSVSREEVVREAGKEVARPIFFAVLIIIIVYLPILTLQGVEGKMFRPMALTVVFALIGSLILALTLMPVLATLAFRKHTEEREPRLVHWLKAQYRPLLGWTLGHPRLTGGVAAGVFVLSLGLIPFMGSEFIPRLDEGAIAVQAWRLPSVALTESVKSTTMIEKTLRTFPEVVTVVSRTGVAEIPTDPMGVETSDIYVILKDHSEWTTARTREGLIDKFNEALEEQVPGNVFSYSQPIELRVQELIAGVRSDVAITVFGEDLDQLRRVGTEIVSVVNQIPGAADVKLEQTAGLPYLRMRIRRDEIARYGINASQVLDAVRTMGGRPVGEVLEGQRRFLMQVRFTSEHRSNVEAIGNIKVADSRGRMIPLSQLADIILEDGPAQISRENIHRKISIEANVRGRDLGSFIAAVQQTVGQRVRMPEGYYVEYGGQFENLQRASQRLALVVPLALFLIFVLLYTTFNAIKPAILIYFNIPIAATGGLVALFLRGMPFSISAGVGFIALFGVAVLNGVVMVSYFRELREQGLSIDDTVRQGAELRLRPVLMTALVAGLGFIPMALSTSAGAEVQQPLATVVIGGLMTSTTLTLLVLPALYRWFERERPEVEL